MGSIEERVVLNEERIAKLVEDLHGGGATPWNRSIRGRLHSVETELDAARLARQALDEVKRQRGRAWTARERHFGLLIAAAGVATPYVLIALHWHR